VVEADDVRIAARMPVTERVVAGVHEDDPLLARFGVFGDVSQGVFRLWRPRRRFFQDGGLPRFVAGDGLLSSNRRSWRFVVLPPGHRRSSFSPTSRLAAGDENVSVP